MAETRRHSTRNRGEPPKKLRKSPEPDPSSPTTAGRKPGRPRKSVSKETPSKGPRVAAKGKAKDSPKPRTPVPETPDAQIEVVEDMSALIEKSRQRWLNDGGVFKKFWTKPPRKRKGMPAPDLPSKQQMNMQDIGPARLIIDPHVFDINIFGVKKPALSWQTPVEGPSNSSTQPSVLKTGAKPTPTATATATATPSAPRLTPQNPYVRPQTGGTAQGLVQPANPRGLAPNPYAMPAGQNTPINGPGQAPQTPNTVGPASSGPVATAGNTSTAGTSSATQAQQPSVTSGSPSGSSQQQPQPQPQPPQQRQQQQHQQPQQQQATPHPDPVIQMLAQRAAGDPVLKELMKVVAAGSESPEKLAEFQRHINEITEIVKQQQAKAQKYGTAHAQPQVHQNPASKQQARSTPSIQSKPPAPVRVDYSQLAFDFIRGGDCYLFPQSSIIQHLADGATTLISFLFTCKGKEVPVLSGSSRLQPEVDYYQPITITLLAVKADIRNALSQVVAKPDQAVQEMNEIMEKYNLAPDAATMLAAAALPAKGIKRDSDGNEKASEHVAARPKTPSNTEAEEDDELKTTWDAPSSLLHL